MLRVLTMRKNIAMVLAEYSQRQYSQISNTVEQYLIDALFGLKVESQYAGQGNIDFPGRQC